MSRTGGALLALGIAVLCGPLGCASGGSTSVTPPAVATVTILRLTPPAGSEIGRDTVLVADVQYSIVGFSADSTYTLVPLLLATDGTTVNSLSVDDALYAIRKPEGATQVEYPIARDWDSGRLAKPVVLSFYVLQKTGAHQARGIGGSEKVQFSAKPD